jgi:hypothetical protein
MADSRAAITVEFLGDGRCVVHSAILSRGSGDLPHQAQAGDFRCDIPYSAFVGRAVELRVTLPPGVEPSDDPFPRLSVHHENNQWVGTASLPAAPAFVSVRSWTAPGDATGAAFGWNFYGFFVFAAAFIAAYFGWARHMSRSRQSEPAP